MNSHKRAQAHTNTSSEMDGTSSIKDFKRSRTKIAVGQKTKTVKKNIFKNEKTKRPCDAKLHWLNHKLHLKAQTVTVSLIFTINSLPPTGEIQKYINQSCWLAWSIQLLLVNTVTTPYDYRNHFSPLAAIQNSLYIDHHERFLYFPTALCHMHQTHLFINCQNWAFLHPSFRICQYFVNRITKGPRQRVICQSLIQKDLCVREGINKLWDAMFVQETCLRKGPI